MDILGTIYFLFKIVLLAFLLLIAHIVYRFIYVPWKIRNKYKQYSNVAMNKKFHLMAGDVADISQNEKDNKNRLLHYTDLAMEGKDYDVYIMQYGPNIYADIISWVGLDEFEKLVPHKIDRGTMAGTPFENISYGALSIMESTKEWSERKKELIGLMGNNHISKYIPLMIETTDEWAKSVKKNERMNLSFEITKIVMKVIAKVLFGTDVDNMPLIPYICPKTKETTHLTLEMFYFQYIKDEFDGFFDIRAAFLPFLAKYKLIEPFKTNFKNNRTFNESIKQFLKTTKDTESVYKRLEATSKSTDDVKLYDMIMLFFGGFDTLSHYISSCIYHLKSKCLLSTFYIIYFFILFWWVRVL